MSRSRLQHRQGVPGRDRNASRPTLLAAAFMAVFLVGAGTAARAQTQYPPPSGKGPVVVMISGQLGPAHDDIEARKLASLGYDVTLLDGNAMQGRGPVLKAAIQQAQSSTHALPGKVAVVGFSLGGGVALAFASHWPDLVATVVAWYPATKFIHDVQGFAGGITVPVLMFAGGRDHYENCCLADTAEALASASTAAGTALEVVTYPDADHDFMFPGPTFDAKASSDSWRKATDRLAQALNH
jgi:dienelactone hydrolase